MVFLQDLSHGMVNVTNYVMRQSLSSAAFPRKEGAALKPQESTRNTSKEQEVLLRYVDS